MPGLNSVSHKMHRHDFIFKDTHLQLEYVIVNYTPHTHALEFLKFIERCGFAEKDHFCEIRPLFKSVDSGIGRRNSVSHSNFNHGLIFKDTHL